MKSARTEISARFNEEACFPQQGGFKADGGFANSAREGFALFWTFTERRVAALLHSQARMDGIKIRGW